MLLVVLPAALTLLALSATSTPPPAASSPWLAPLAEQQGARQSFMVKQVPGDGACLFNALAECLRQRHCGVHRDFDGVTAAISAWLRETAVDVLSCEDRELVAEDGAALSTAELLRMVAEHYNTTAEEYCNKMRLRHTWGGGPEIVALSNYLRTPIHVYDLAASGLFAKRFCLRLSARFGSPTFDAEEPISILCCDGRYPHIRPGEQIAIGDHFMALFPIPSRAIRRDWGRSASPVEVLGNTDASPNKGFRNNAALQEILDTITARAATLQSSLRGQRARAADLTSPVQ